MHTRLIKYLCNQGKRPTKRICEEYTQITLHSICPDPGKFSVQYTMYKGAEVSGGGIAPPPIPSSYRRRGRKGALQLKGENGGRRRGCLKLLRFKHPAGFIYRFSFFPRSQFVKMKILALKWTSSIFFLLDQDLFNREKMVREQHRDIYYARYYGRCGRGDCRRGQKI